MAWCLMQIFQRIEELAPKDVTRTFIEGGGVCIFIYSCFAQQISSQIEELEFDLKIYSSGRT